MMSLLEDSITPGQTNRQNGGCLSQLAALVSSYSPDRFSLNIIGLNQSYTHGFFKGERRIKTFLGWGQGNNAKQILFDNWNKPCKKFFSK